jgi:two-component sensor histidine kinase
VLDNALRQNPNPHLKLSGQVSGARVRLPSRQATSLASVLNELVYNAVVHAFTGREHGNIAISMQEATGGEILVQVSDDGVGLPRDFNLQHHAHLGLRIVEGLVSQDLGGEFTITGNGGTIARVAFRK